MRALQTAQCFAAPPCKSCVMVVRLLLAAMLTMNARSSQMPNSPHASLPYLSSPFVTTRRTYHAGRGAATHSPTPF